MHVQNARAPTRSGREVACLQKFKLHTPGFVAAMQIKLSIVFVLCALRTSPSLQDELRSLAIFFVAIERANALANPNPVFQTSMASLTASL